MPAPEIDALPAIPNRGDDPATFSEDINAFFAALPDFRSQMNALAAWMETDGGLSAVRAATPHASAYANTTQSISPSTPTKVNLGTEVYDTASNFASSEFTVPATGFYHVSAQVTYTGVSLGSGVGYALIASVDVDGSPKASSSVELEATGAFNRVMPMAKTLYLTAEQVVSLKTIHSYSGPLDVTNGEGVTFMTIDRIF